MGKTGLGTLMELGSEGDLGADNVAELPYIYTSEADWTCIQTYVMYCTDLFLHLPADVLVGRELSSRSSRKYSYL